MKTIHFKDEDGRYIYFASDIASVLYLKNNPKELTIEFRDSTSFTHFHFKSPFKTKWVYRKITRQLHKK